MSLYDRDYVNSAASRAEEPTARSEGYTQERVDPSDRSSIVAFLRKTYQIFAASLVAAATGAYVGLGFSETIATWYWGLVILELGLLFGIYALRSKPGLNLAVLFAFTLVSGLTLAPLLSHILGLPGGGAIVAKTFATTSVIFGVLSFYSMTTTRDFTSMGKPLFIALIVILVMAVVNIFLGSPLLQVGIASFGALLFSAFIVYDTQNIIKGAFASPVEAAVALYIDFLNLFVSLLQLFGIFSSDE